MNTQRMTLCALCAALTALCAQIALPIGTVPVSLALLPLLTCAALLPPGCAVATALLYLCMGVIGLPVFSGMAGGIGVLLGATGGYLLGYIACAAVTSWCIRRRMHPLCAMALGLAACYLLGTLWLGHTAGLSLPQAFAAGTLPFIPGDAAKAVLAHMLARRLKGAVRGMRG